MAGGTITGPEATLKGGAGQGLTKAFYPEASNAVIFLIMALVLLVRPAGLFGKEA